MKYDASIILTLTVFTCGFISCKTDVPAKNLKSAYQRIEGSTMGTTYHVTYFDSTGINRKQGVDSVLLAVNHEVSTYEVNSFITKFNHSKEGLPLIGHNGKAIAPHFLANFDKSDEVFRLSGGVFDPTVMPLVNYWGFGYKGHTEISAVDSAVIDSLKRHFVGWKKVAKEKRNGGIFLSKSNPNVELDFSAVAKGYGVDAVAIYLEGKGINHYLVEIGGEVRAAGLNEKGQAWIVGINEPLENAAITDFFSKARMSDLSLATSGNYRNFYEVDGIKYSHTINPATGFPERTTLLSASVFARDCATADAWATACMVLGVEKAFTTVSALDGIDCYLIFSNPDGTLGTKITPGLDSLIIK